MSKAQSGQDLNEPFFFVLQSIQKKMLIFARESMSNLPNSSISLWTAKNINKINSRKDLFDFVCKSHFPQLNLVRTLPNLSFLFLWNIEKMLILVRVSMPIYLAPLLAFEWLNI